MAEAFNHFARNCPEALLAQLKTDPLFKNHLWEDIMRMEGRTRCERVFPAVRDGRIDFYHRGGKLFTYNRGFRTNLKYAASLSHPKKKGTDISEEELREVRCISDFSSGYRSIKRLCSLYARPEARGVSEVYGRFPFTMPFPFVVLDIEASFDARFREDSENEQDRIDLVLLDREKRELLFVEAKRLENPDVRAAGEPAVVAQIRRYRDQVAAQRNHILAAYRCFVAVVNELFDLDLQPPIGIVSSGQTGLPTIPLLIFDYDDPQERSVLRPTQQKLRIAGVCGLKCGRLDGLKTFHTLQSWFSDARKFP